MIQRGRHKYIAGPLSQLAIRFNASLHRIGLARLDTCGLNPDRKLWSLRFLPNARTDLLGLTCA